MTKLEIAKHILNTCYWGNTTMTPEYIVKNINNKDIAKQIFSAIFQNSQTMIEDLNLIDKNLVKEFIVEQNQKLGYFKRFYLEPRLDELIKYYEIKDAGRRREIHTII